MAKYRGSPWGELRGKLFDHVGGIWKGVRWTRFLAYPTQRGTLGLYHLLKDGLIPPERFSYPQFNIRRAVLQVLGYIARMNLSTWIYPVWEALCTKRAWVMTGTNAFVRRNAATLLTSMDRDTEYDETNQPDLTKMLISDGDLEPAAGLLTATYDPALGTLTVTWDPTVYTNGADTDIAFVMVAAKYPDTHTALESIGDEGTWAPKLYMYGTALVPEPPAVPKIRVDATYDLTLPMGLTADDLTAYLFFRDKEDIIGYSPSFGYQVVAGP